MKRWPSVSTVLLYWGAVTLLLVGLYVVRLRHAPHDELEMANTLSFQVVVAILSVAVPSLVFLFSFLLIGAIAKRWLLGSNPSIEGTCSGGLRPPTQAPHVKR